jgi:hypothetical protein
MTTTAQPPSDGWDAEPAVIVPSGLNAGRSLAGRSAVVPRRMPSSCSRVADSPLRPAVVHGHDLLGQPAFLGGRGRPGVRLGRNSSWSARVTPPLRVLEDSRLLVKEPDLFRTGRATYRIAEPLITFYQAIMSRDWARLERGDGATIWHSAQPRFLSRIVGPHFETICRDYAIMAGPEVFGGLPAQVGAGVVADPANRTHIQVDVAVLAPAEHGQPRKLLSLGEAKWDRVMGQRHVERLRRARDLLTAKGFDTRDTVLACYSGAGFDPDLAAGRPGDIRLIGLDQLYAD